LSIDSIAGLYYDPYRPDINADPYPVYRRLRDEAPLYYNEPHDFYAVSRFEDVERCLVDRETFSSAKSSVLEIIRSDFEMPPGVFIFEDPAAPHGPSRLGLARLHAAQDGGHRTAGAGLLRTHPRSAGRQQHV